MKWKLWLAMGAAAVVVFVLFPPLAYLVIGALAMFIVAALYITLTGLNQHGQQRANVAEARREVYGQLLRAGLLRRQARREVAVEDEKERIRAGR